METNAHRFLTAFAAIESRLAQEQTRRETPGDWATFSELLHDSDTLLRHQKENLRQFAKLRNSISHESYLRGQPIADPRDDTVNKIEEILQLLIKPPLLIEALKNRGRPKVFTVEDPLSEFLELITVAAFSQAPVQTGKGYALVTTNAVARWFADHLVHKTTASPDTPLGEILNYAEPGDSLKTVKPTTTAVQAINIFAGETEPQAEPPTALLVLGKMGQAPQTLCSRSDLSLLYALIN